MCVREREYLCVSLLLSLPQVSSSCVCVRGSENVCVRAIHMMRVRVLVCKQCARAHTHTLCPRMALGIALEAVSVQGSDQLTRIQKSKSTASFTQNQNQLPRTIQDRNQVQVQNQLQVFHSIGGDTYRRTEDLFHGKWIISTASFPLHKINCKFSIALNQLPLQWVRIAADGGVVRHHGGPLHHVA